MTGSIRGRASPSSSHRGQPHARQKDGRASRAHPSSHVGRADLRAPVRRRSSASGRPETSRTGRTARRPAAPRSRTAGRCRRAGRARRDTRRSRARTPARRRRTDPPIFIGMSSPDDDRCRHSPRSALPTTRGIVVRLEPSRAQLNPARGQTGEAALELGAARAVAGDEDDEVREPAVHRRRLPPADPLLEPHDGVDHDVEILVLGPARRTHDEADGFAADAEAREQRLAETARVRRDRSARTPTPGDRRAPLALRTPNRLSRNAARPRDTHRFASTRRASRRSNQRASRTAGCQRPEPQPQQRDSRDCASR